MDRTKTMWQLINRETGKTPENDSKLELRIGKETISYPTEITEKFYRYCERIGKAK